MPEREELRELLKHSMIFMGLFEIQSRVLTTPRLVWRKRMETGTKSVQKGRSLEKNEKSRKLVCAPRIYDMRDAGLRRWNTFKCRRNGKRLVRALQILHLRGAAAGNLQYERTNCSGFIGELLQNAMLVTLNNQTNLFATCACEVVESDLPLTSLSELWSLDISRIQKSEVQLQGRIKARMQMRSKV
ncbi:hypothetical protein L2E82_14266 [Cichorium intybus]|uniref:Uncharacterized protein n=1 Tax=Cichorium intybus TaxID=13427 RepID=A0ACB9EZZ2_CICIN|nr:hypothetical protein L2E82_14266 [Cichorium intybus]